MCRPSLNFWMPCIHTCSKRQVKEARLYKYKRCLHWLYLFIKGLQDFIKEERRIEVNRDVIFDGTLAYKRSKDIPIEFDEEDTPPFEDDEQHDKSPTNIKDRPSEPIQPTIIPKVKKRPTWLRATLEEAEGHKATEEISKKARSLKDTQDIQHT